MQQLANLRMSPVDTDLTWGHNNQLNFANSCVMYESDSDDEEDGTNGESEEISAEEVHLQVLTDDDILNGYVPDDRYNITDMEEDEEYSEDLEWEYADIGEEEEDVQYLIYDDDGLGPSSKCIVPFQDFIGCL